MVYGDAYERVVRFNAEHTAKNQIQESKEQQGLKEYLDIYNETVDHVQPMIDDFLVRQRNHFGPSIEWAYQKAAQSYPYRDRTNSFLVHEDPIGLLYPVTLQTTYSEKGAVTNLYRNNLVNTSPDSTVLSINYHTGEWNFAFDIVGTGTWGKGGARVIYLASNPDMLDADQGKRLASMGAGSKESFDEAKQFIPESLLAYLIHFGLYQPEQ